MMLGEAVDTYRFIVDANVGRLAKWLRIMGYDVLFVPGIEDAELVRLALQERRAIITRDRLVMRRRAIASGRLSALLVSSDRLVEQLRQVVEVYGLDASGGFSRCVECNETLRSVERAAAHGRVPAYVYETQETFVECPVCMRLYWRGTHWRNMVRELATVGGGRS
ncbi:MAG: Mut7-C RNAse domain-containing protein [Chloroflexota bacterium]|nr:Mut7-C RNAse domain-containing protein [Chloroflexota bacterium]MDE2941482.1 Mut7-C RNAse domain-containing protein [Chloroflexota bacterium]MDE3268094.1 Mut7-C RNAse domain-containing protein [Chloroflexota bacterium]